MLYLTHVVGGLSVGMLLTQYYVRPEERVAALLIIGVASLLPDLDSQQSFVGSRMPFFSWLMSSVFGHRGFIHSLLGCAMWLVVIFLVLKMVGLDVYQGIVLSAFAIGYITHLIMDILTLSGIPLLWPWKAKIRIPIARTGGLLEKLVILPALSIFLFFQI